MPKKARELMKTVRTSPKPSTGTKPNVRYTRSELTNYLTIYYIIRDCIEGEPAIKGLISGGNISANPAAYNGGGDYSEIYTNVVMARAMRYLPKPNPDDLSQQNSDRYRAYLARAVFYNVTARTLEGLVGQIFLRNPITHFPPQLDVLKTDANGSGLSLVQLAKRAVRYTLPYGRAGILTDYPPVQGPTTKAKQDSGELKPNLTVFQPWNIINWRMSQTGSKRYLSLIVLREPFEDDADDGFAMDIQERYRVLRLDSDSGNYIQRVYNFDNDGNVVDAEQEYMPLDADGKPFKEIPFSFIGSENNDEAVDRPPMYDMVSINLGHYRNSADFEESSFIMGQPTLAISGLSQAWYEDVMKKQVVMGSRGGLPLPVGGDAKLLQANANTIAKEAMLMKEDQMVALGAKLVQKMKTVRTATETIIETTSESSTLANVAINVSAAFVQALSWAAKFSVKGFDRSTVNVVKDNAKPAIQFDLNTDFDLMQMTPDERQELIREWQAGAIAFEEMREGLRQAGVAKLDNQTALVKIGEEQSAAIAVGGAPIADPLIKAKLKNDPGNDPEPANPDNPSATA